MLRGVSPNLSPDLLADLSRMGHGDWLVLADAHFPGHSNNPRTHRADGSTVTELLDAMLPLYPVDTYTDHPVAMIDPVPGDEVDPAVAEEISRSLKQKGGFSAPIELVDRYEFYRRTRQAFAVVMTGERRKYGCIMLQKGVVV